MQRIAMRWAAALVAACGGLCAAAGPNKGADANPADLKKENAELRNRVGTLENKVGQLEQIVLQQSEAMKADRKNEKKRLADEDLQKIREIIRAEGGGGNHQNVWANLDVQLYGYIKLDASYDTARTDEGNYGRWVETEEYRSSDNDFNMTARQTRLGLKIKGPDAGPAKTSGLLEIDFYGGGAENKPTPMIRHAYLKIEWPDQRFSILAGQTWDTFSPLNPDTVNYSVLWWQGNIGYRRPQVRATQEIALSKDVDLKLEGAVARSIGHDDGLLDPGDTGEDAGYPCLQGRASLTFPLFGGKKTTIGASGHFGPEEYDTDYGGASVKVYSWSANLDLTMPINDWLTIAGEMFTGQNLDAYLGGIGQGVDVLGYSFTELKACGGWLAASLGPWGKWRFNVGAGVDAVNDEDFSASSTIATPVRTANTIIFGNVFYSLNENTIIAVEISHLHTDYYNQDSGSSLRFQTAFIYKF